MRLEHIDSFHGIFDVSPRVDSFDSLHGINSHGSKQVVITELGATLAKRSPDSMGVDSRSNDFARHRGLCCIDQRLPTQSIYFHTQVINHKLACLSTSQSVTGDDGRRVDFHLHKLICSSKEFCSNDHNGGRPISHFLVLLLCQVDKYSPGRVLDFKQRENGCTVVRNGNFLIYFQRQSMRECLRNALQCYPQAFCPNPKVLGSF